MSDQPFKIADDPYLNPEPFPPLKSRPVFVLGSVRSGTSAVFKALKDGAGLPGYYEGHVTVFFQRVLDIARETYGNYGNSVERYLLGQVDIDGFSTHVVNYMKRVLGRAYPDGMWIDKTPDDFPRAPAIRSAPLMLEMFPEAKFVYCLRRGIENVLSRSKKFPQNPFWYHCRSWAETVKAWFDVKEALGDRAITVSQQELSLYPKRITESLRQFLGLSAAQSNGVEQTLSSARVEQTRPAMEHRELSLYETGWDPGLIDVFLQECEEAMHLAGFSLEGRTVAEKAGVPLFYTGRVQGQADIENIDASGYFAVDPRSFTLGPGRAGTPARVTYRDLPLQGLTGFASNLRVEGGNPRAVRYRVEVWDSSDKLLMDEDMIAEPSVGGTFFEKRFQTSPSTICMVRLSTELAQEGSVQGVEARWYDPRFF